jgi:hypothetical protein
VADSLVTWEQLECLACQSKHFLSRTSLQVKPGAGMTTTVTGWQCCACGTEADLTAMQQRLRLQRQQRELAMLEQEIAAQTPAAPGVRGVTRASTAS